MRFRKKDSRSGFLMPLVAGLLLAAGSAATLVVVKKENTAFWEPKTEAIQDLTNIQNALVAYQQEYHRLPCPAPRGGAPTGISVANCSVAGAGNVVMGLAAGVIHIGALPYATLKMGSTAGEDRYGNRFTYAVLVNFTDPFQFSTAVGGITVQNNTGGTLIANAAYVVLSHGSDGAGAYTAKGGIRVKDCPSLGLTKDAQNCNDDGTFVKADLVTTAGTTHYDDAIVWGTRDAIAATTNMPCLNGAVNWTVDNGNGARNCSGTFSAPVPGVADGDPTPSITNTAANHAGSATFTCNNGTLAANAGATCVAHCTAPLPAQTWTAHNCTGTPTGSLNDGANQSVANTAPGRTGSVTVTCGDGVLTQSALVCNPNGCTGTTHNWGAGCTGTSSTMAHGATPTVTDSNTAGGYTGTLNLSCQYGTWSVTGSNCYANCTGTAHNWGNPPSGQQCTANSSTSAHGATPTINNTLANHSGSLALTCSNGTWTPGASSCTYTPPNCGATSVGWGAGCSRAMPAMTHGQTLTNQANTASGYTGTADVTCTAGTVGTSGSPTCNANCNAATVNWSPGCEGSAAAMNHGAPAQNVTNGASGYTGSVTMSCNNGTLSQSGATCSASSCSAYERKCDTGPLAAYEANCTAKGGTPNIQPGSMLMNCLGNTEPSFNVRCCNCTPCVNYIGMESDIYGTAGTASCWEYNHANCSVEIDAPTCDGGPMGQPPAGWSQCSSDRRLKTDIIQVASGKEFNIYEFSYRNDPQHRRYRGVMAQEVMNIPHAVVTMQNGYYAVNYGVVGVPFERLD